MQTLIEFIGEAVSTCFKLEGTIPGKEVIVAAILDPWELKMEMKTYQEICDVFDTVPKPTRYGDGIVRHYGYS